MTNLKTNQELATKLIKSLESTANGQDHFNGEFLDLIEEYFQDDSKTLDLHQDTENIFKQFSKFVKSNSRTKSYKGDFGKEEGILQHITLDVGGYYCWRRKTHLPKVEIKITPAKK
jgi:hypothetical protein